MLSLLHNVHLKRGVNWSLLADPLYDEFEKLTAVERIAPQPPGLRTIAANAHALRRFAASKAAFSMHGHWRAEWPIMAASLLHKPKVRAIWFVDPWPYTLDRVHRANAVLRTDLAFIPYTEALRDLAQKGGRTRYVHLSYAADTNIFRDRGLARDIDILSLGRRCESLHVALQSLAERHGLRYETRETIGFLPDPEDFAATLARARYFVTTPPDLFDKERSAGYSPLTMRYLEALAAGCRPLGVLPASGEFEAILPRQAMLVVKPDGSDLEERFVADQGDAAAWQATADAARTVREKHGWDSRAKTILARMSELAGTQL